jgi:hypothetical protein
MSFELALDYAGVMLALLLVVNIVWLRDDAAGDRPERRRDGGK